MHDIDQTPRARDRSPESFEGTGDPDVAPPAPAGATEPTTAPAAGTSSSSSPGVGRALRLLVLLAFLGAVALFAPDLQRVAAPTEPALAQVSGPPPVVAPTGALEAVYDLSRDASVRIEGFCSGAAFGATLGVGTGFFIRDDGTLLTAYHVVDPSNAVAAECQVEHRAVTTDGSRYPLELVGFDAYFDLAVMRAEVDVPAPFVPLAGGDPSPGDAVVAIGNSRNDFLAARAGQVTRLGVQAARANFADDTIELTAALAPGDSGGPVLNRAGEAIGVVSYISFNPGALDSDGFVPPFLLGLTRPDFASYAVPVGVDDDLVTALLAGEQRDVPVIGLSWRGFDPAYDPDAWEPDLGPRPGTVVQFVQPGGPADAAGLRSLERSNRFGDDGQIGDIEIRADVVVAVEGIPTRTLDELMRIVRSFRIGETVTLTVQRGNATLRIPLELGAKRTVFGGVD